jgi:hypothetical protein
MTQDDLRVECLKLAVASNAGQESINVAYLFYSFVKGVYDVPLKALLDAQLAALAAAAAKAAETPAPVIVEPAA